MQQGQMKPEWVSIPLGDGVWRDFDMSDPTQIAEALKYLVEHTVKNNDQWMRARENLGDLKMELKDSKVI